MKLKNFMFATMIACAFASCSKDDVIDNGTGPVTKGDASLTVSVGTMGTKGVIITENQPETTVNDINIFLCNENGSVKEHVYLDADILAKNTATFNDLVIGETLYCVGFANFGSAMTSLPVSGELIAATHTVNGTNLPMHGLSEKVEIEATGNVATINLVRDLARVELMSVQLDMDHALQDEFKTGTFTFDFVSASINSAASKSTVTYETSLAKRAFAVGTEYVGGLKDWAYGNVTNNNLLANYIKSDDNVNNATFEKGVTPSAQVVTIPNSTVFYVLPNEAKRADDNSYANMDHPTVLTLNGTMGITNAERTNGQIVASNTINSYYNVEIGKTGAITGQDSGAGVLPNKSYEIELTVVGTGDGISGDRPSLVVNTKVKDWDKVSQIAPVK